MKNPLPVLALAACLAAPASAADRLLVQVPAVLGPGAPIAEAVRAQCAVESLVGNFVLKEVGLRTTAVPIESASYEGPEPFLRLTLLSVHGVGGGSWSGAKSVSLRVELMEQGRSVSSMVFNRNSRGGVLGGVSGTCPIFERIAIVLGRDVANWVPFALNSRNASRATDSRPARAAEPSSEPAKP